MKRNNSTLKSLTRLGTASALALSIAMGASANAQDKISFDIPAQPLGDALLTYSEQSERAVMASPELVKGKSAPAVSGDMTTDEALDLLLKDSGLDTRLNTQGGVTVVQTAALNEEGRRNRGFLRLAQADAPNASSDAQLTGRVDTYETDVIIVTAQRREQDIKDVPQSVFALSETQLQAQRIENFEDLGFAVPGLSVVDSGLNQQRIYMRGLGNLVGDPLVGVYLDDTSTVTESVSQLNFRTYDIERVEVLKGPQGTLYGQGSVGGTVRFITRNPDLTSFGGRADASVSFTEDGATSQDIKAVVNVPIVEDKLGIRVSGVFENAGGWIDQPTAGQEDVNDATVTSVRAKILFEPTEDLSLLGTVAIFRLDGGLFSTDGRGNIDNNEFEQPFGLLTTPSREQDYEIYSLNGSYDFGPVNLVSITSYVEQERSVKNGPLGPNGFDYGFDSIQQNERVGSAFTQELRLSSDNDGGLYWLLGGIYSEIETGAGFIFEFGPSDGDIVGSFDRNIDPVEKTDKSESWAIFGETSLELGDKWEVGGGFRYFENDKSNQNLSETFDALTGRVFVKYAVTDDVNIYANAGQGFRSGGFNGTNVYDPETTWSYDLGAKGFLFDGAVDFDVALFFSEIQDFQIVSQIPTQIQPRIDNGGTAEIPGVEWNIGWRVSDQLRLNAHGTYVEPELVEADFPGQPLAEGDQLSFVPKYQFGFDAVYSFDFVERPATFTLNYNQRDSIFDIARNDFFSREAKSGVIGLLNANLDWNYSDTVTLSVFASNLLDESDSPAPLGDDTFVEDQRFGTGQSAQGGIVGAIPPRPRTFGFSLGVEF